MPTVTLTPSLRQEYTRLFDSCDVRPKHAAEVDRLVDRILANRARYEAVARATGVPWYFVGVVHCLEAGLDFRRHLHNGDPLSARTVQVPAGRPRSGAPPFTWEESAADALALQKLGPRLDWSLPGTLFQLERYNGFGYRLRHPEVLSPYLWSFSCHYERGKYVADGTWSPTAVSKQCGAAALLRRLAERGEIGFPDQAVPDPGHQPLVRYSAARSANPAEVARAEDLQRWLNSFPGIFVKVDGVPGPRTSDAFERVTGWRLPGDPRG